MNKLDEIDTEHTLQDHYVIITGFVEDLNTGFTVIKLQLDKLADIFFG